MPKPNIVTAQVIREIGESLIKNAESLAGCEEFAQGFDIHVKVGPEVLCDAEFPVIEFTKIFVPERSVLKHVVRRKMADPHAEEKD